LPTLQVDGVGVAGAQSGAVVASYVDAQAVLLDGRGTNGRPGDRMHGVHASPGRAHLGALEGESVVVEEDLAVEAVEHGRAVAHGARYGAWCP
jgi:hypothetical protein